MRVPVSKNNCVDNNFLSLTKECIVCIVGAKRKRYFYTCISKKYQKYQKIPKNTKKYQKIPKNTKKYQKIPKNTKNFKKYQKLRQYGLVTRKI
jgi:hypothetical protein